MSKMEQPGNVATDAAITGSLSGIAHGGRQSISGADVYAFAAGKTGYGSPAHLLAQTTTATDGTGAGRSGHRFSRYLGLGSTFHRNQRLRKRLDRQC
jgi:hypothetical protein